MTSRFPDQNFYTYGREKILTVEGLLKFAQIILKDEGDSAEFNVTELCVVHFLIAG
jgi:hypothetical protein